jgi:hypothetical protein
VRYNLKIDFAAAEADRRTAAAAARWRRAARAPVPLHVLRELWHRALSEFYALAPDRWPDPGPFVPDPEFVPVWPRAPAFVEEGAAIVRFLTAPECPHAIATIKNTETGEVTDACDICQFEFGAKLETVARIRFPQDGRFDVTFGMGPPGVVNRREAGEFFVMPQMWKFAVEGAPPPRRPLWQILAGRKVARLACPHEITVEPSESIVHVPGLVYSFRCRFREQKPGIEVRELPGDPPEWLVHAEGGVEGDSDDGWGEVKCEVACPRAGAWRVLFTISESCVVTQVIVAGPLEKLEPTAEESAAFGVPVPLPPPKVAVPIVRGGSRDLPVMSRQQGVRAIRSAAGDVRVKLSPRGAGADA